MDGVRCVSSSVAHCRFLCFVRWLVLCLLWRSASGTFYVLLKEFDSMSEGFTLYWFSLRNILQYTGAFGQVRRILSANSARVCWHELFWSIYSTPSVQYYLCISCAQSSTVCSTFVAMWQGIIKLIFVSIRFCARLLLRYEYR